MNIDQLEQSLKRNIVVLFILGIIVSAILGTVIYRSDIVNRFDSISTQHQRIIAQSWLLWGQHIGDMNHTIELLYQLPELNLALSSDQAVNIDLMQKVFASFISSVDTLMQVRWLNAQGIERVRLDMLQGKVVTVAPENLQDKSDRYYFMQGMNAGEGQVFLSEIDLNVENGQIELPYRPTLRITIRTGAATGLHDGLLVLNYDVGKLIEMIDTFDSDLVQLLIVQQSGFWVKHFRPDYEWGNDLNHQDYSIKRQAPQLWQHIKQNTSATLIPSPFGLVSYQCSGITPNEVAVKNLSLCFISSTPKSDVSQVRVRSLLLATSVSGAILLFGLVVLKREWGLRQKLLQLYRTQEHDRRLIEESAQYSHDLLQQQQLLQDDLVESRKLSALGMMVAGVAHELNTPVGSAIMTTSRLQKNPQDLMEAVENGLTKSALQQYLESNVTGLALVEQSQKRAAKLIRSFKRLAIDRAREEVVQFDFKQVVDDLMLTLEPRFKHTLIEQVIDVDKITMVGKPGIISQVIQNLIINALQHAFSDNDNLGGRLILSGKLQGDNDMVEIRVIDNGAGVEQQILANIFEPFITSSRAKGNTGLGMHFVHQWVTIYLQGSISVDSEVGQGTCFTIQVPRHLS